MMRGAALCLVLLLAVGLASGQTPSPSPAPECTIQETDLNLVNWAPVKKACGEWKQSGLLQFAAVGCSAPSLCITAGCPVHCLAVAAASHISDTYLPVGMRSLKLLLLLLLAPPLLLSTAVPAATKATTTNATDTYCNTCICSMSDAIQTGLAANKIVLTAAQRDSMLSACIAIFAPILMDETKANLTEELGEVAAKCGDYAAIIKTCPAVNTTNTTTASPSPTPSTAPTPAPTPGTPTVTASPPPKNSAMQLAMPVIALAAAVALQVMLA